MTCKETQELASAYLDRQLTPAESTEVRLHLDLCAACRAQERTLLELKEKLRAVKMPGMPAHVLAAIKDETMYKPSMWESLAGTQRWAPLAVGILLGLGAFLFAHYKVSPRMNPKLLALSPQVSSAPVVAMHSDQEPDLTEKYH